MGKICVVKSCPSGRKLKNKNDNSPQSTSYFQPTTSTRLENWKTSLGINLKVSDYVCHFHFKEEDIKMYDKFFIKGELIIYPKGKKQLKDDALPTIEHQFVPLYFSQTEDKQQCQVEKHQIEQQNVLVNQESNNLIDAIIKTELDSKELPLSQHAHDIESHKETEKRTQLEDLTDDIKKNSLLPPSWLFIDKPNGFEFMRVDVRTRKIVNHLRLIEDMSITVIFPNNEEFPLKEKIDSFHDVYNYLKSVERWPLCVGTQIDNNSYSKNCKGVIIGEETYKRNQPNPRCKSCRILRNRLQNRPSTSNYLERIIIKKRRNSNLVRQCKRLKRTNIRLKEKILMAKSEYVNKSEPVVQNAIKKSPKHFQTTVNSCFAAAKKKSAGFLLGSSNMCDVKMCLACLTTENTLERSADIIKRFYVTLTGIKLSTIDGYPMYFCVECHSQIRRALVFKRKCRRAHYVLKEIASVKKQCNDEEAKIIEFEVNNETALSPDENNCDDILNYDIIDNDTEDESPELKPKAKLMVKKKSNDKIGNQFKTQTKTLPQCDSIISGYKTYSRHHKRVRRDVPIWRLRDMQLCELCGEAVLDIAGHMKKHDEKEVVVLECRHCYPPVLLRDVWKYCVHMLTLHTPRPFTCGVCREAYPTRRDCKDHILKLHAPVNPYKCTTCEQEFSHIDYLSEHRKKSLHLNTERPMRVNTKEKLYTYPHMKLNVSMFDRRVLGSVHIYMCDYRGTKCELIRDIKDYIVFDKQDDSSRINSEKKKRHKTTGGGEIGLSLRKSKIVEDIHQRDDFNDTSAAGVKERKIKAKETENNVQCLRRDLYESEDRVYDEDLLPPVKKKRGKERRKRRIEKGEECTDDLGLGFGGQKFNVIELDGRQYVSMNGNLYQVVQEDDTV